MVLSSVALSFRLGHLTLTEGDRHLADARAKLVRRAWVPTVRGSILDRRGRVLAADRPAYAVVVDYAVLAGRWPAQHAAAAARQAAGERWADLSAAQRRDLTRRAEDLLTRHVQGLWRRLAPLVAEPEAALAARAGEIVRRVEAMHATLTDARRRAELDDRARRGLSLTESDRRAVNARAAAPIAEQRTPHPILQGLDDQTGFQLARDLDRQVTLRLGEDFPEPVTLPFLPGLALQDSTERLHPFGQLIVTLDGTTLPGPARSEGPVQHEVTGVGANLLGAMRDKVFAEDIDRRNAALAASPALRDAAMDDAGNDRGAYFPSDRVGHTGVEASLEPTLRGLRGLRTQRLDTGEAVELPAQPGRDVTLTIDANLQARLRAVLDPRLGLAAVQPWHENESLPVGSPLACGLVVLEIDTGDILALVSTPSPEDLEDPDNPPTWVDDPWVHRAIAKPYPPGSIAKALMLPEAVTRGVHTLNAGIRCTGHLLPNRPDLFRCWVYKRYNRTHGVAGEPVRAAESLMVSCNIFYYTLGQRLGPTGVAAAYQDFGLGEPFNLGVGPEWPGHVGPTTGPGDGTDLQIADGILMAMGQGPVTWTPLHAADAYATLARGGVRIRPRIVRDGSAPDIRELNLRQDAIDAALEGLHLSVNDPRGTGSTVAIEGERVQLFDIPGVHVWGKTGTAEAPDLRHDPDGPEGPAPPQTVRTGDHAWFVILAGPEGERPTLALSLIVEYGGSGGKVAGPLAAQALRACLAEGFITPAAPVASAARPSRAATRPSPPQ